MANIVEPTAEMEVEWLRWCSTRPAHVRAVAETFRPWKLYLLKSSGHRVTLYSFGEDKDTKDVTVKVNVLALYNKVAFERQVFGIPPDDLEECDLPAAGEELGARFTEENEIKDYVDKIRPDVIAGRRGLD